MSRRVAPAIRRLPMRQRTRERRAWLRRPGAGSGVVACSAAMAWAASHVWRVMMAGCAG